MATVQLAQTLRTARERSGLSLRDLSVKTGLASSYLNRLELGKVQEPGCHSLRKLAGALGLTYASLMKQAGYYP